MVSTPQRKISRAHIIGAGVAGLSSAVHLIKQGIDVHVYEASRQAGGRCRSYFDDRLGVEIDNGNHLLLGCNIAALDFIETLGTTDTFTTTSPPAFPFYSIDDKTHWSVSLQERLPKIPGVLPWEYIWILTLLWVNKHRTLANCLNTKKAIYKKLWEPMAVSILNTLPEDASARLFGAVVKHMLLSDKHSLCPYLPKISWSESLIEPALLFLHRHEGEVHFQHRLRSLTFEHQRITGLDFGEKIIGIGEDEVVIIAVPPYVLPQLLPRITVPTEYQAIVNVHYKFEHSEESILGIIGGTAQWLFFGPGIISTTTSAANRLAQENEDAIAELIWSDIQKALDINDGVPANRVIKEKRATFACTPDNLKRRPDAITQYDNLFLAGDYTDTGLPGTIEGAVISGKRVVEALLARDLE